MKYVWELGNGKVGKSMEKSFRLYLGRNRIKEIG
jgi:hypothetical protein